MKENNAVDWLKSIMLPSEIIQVFRQIKPMIDHFVWLNKLAQLAQMTQLA